MTKTLWAVEFTNTDGQTTGHLFDTPDALGNFVRVNAEDVCTYRINAVDEGTLATERVAEAFT